MGPHIEIVGDQIISTPKRLLDFVAVVSWKKGQIEFSFTSIKDQALSGENLFHLWVGLSGFMLEQKLPPHIEKILITALQTLNPKFTYESKIERGP